MDVDCELNSQRNNQFRLTTDEIQLGLANLVNGSVEDLQRTEGIWRSGSMIG